MLWTVTRKELVEIWRDGRLRLLAGGLVALLVVAMANGLASASQAAAERAASVEADARNFLGQGDKNPHAAGHYGQFAFRPMPWLAAVEPGVIDYVGTAIWLEAHRMNMADFRPAEDALELGRFGRLSGGWLLQWVVPLLILTLAFGIVAGERERGTLALSLAQGVKPSTLMAGKLLAVLIALALTLAPGVLVLLLGLAAAAGAGAEALRVGLLGLAYGLYFLAVAGFAVAVSACVRRRAGAFLLLLVGWLVAVVIVPRLATDVGEELYPTPDATGFWAEIKANVGGHGNRIAVERRRLLEARYLEEYGVDDVADLPFNFTAVYLQDLEEQGYAVFDRAYDGLWSVYEAQRGVRQAFSLVSPFIAVRELSMALAQTDGFHHRHFSLAAEAHRRELITALNTYQAEHGAGQRFFVADGSLWSEMPTLRYAPPALGAVMSRHTMDWTVLALWAFAGLAALGLAARRLRPF